MRSGTINAKARSCSLAGLLMALASGPALAAPVCTSNAAYLVVEAPHAGAVGNSYIVRDAKAVPKPLCSTQTAKGDIVIGGKDDPYFLLKLAGKYLLLDSGTGPDRTLVIRDLAAGTTLFEGGYADDDIAIDAGRATFWAQSHAKPSAANCRDLASITKNGLTPAIETLTTFEFSSGELTRGEATRCVAHQ